MDIQEFRSQYPQYNDVSDADLSRSLHEKFYSDVPYHEFESTFVGSTRPSDYAKSFASGALSGAGLIAQGGGELLARGINAVAPEAELRSVNPLQGAIDWLESSKSPAAHAAEANTQIGGNLLDPSSYSWGENPSLAGLTLQGLNAIGQFAPNLAIALGTAGASVPTQLSIGAVTGGLQALGGGAEQERQAINEMGPEELQASSALYRTLTSRGVDHRTAKDAVAEAAAIGGGIGNAIPSAAEGAFENFLVGALTRGKFKIPTLGGGLAGRVAVGVGGGAALGGTEEAVEQVGQNIGSNLAIGGNRPLTADTLQQFVMGAIAEGTAGAGGAAMSHVTQPAQNVLKNAQTVPADQMAATALQSTPAVRQAVQALDSAPDVDTAIQAAAAIVDAPVAPVIAHAEAFAQAETEAGKRKAAETEAAYQQREDRIAQLNRMIQMELERDAARTEAGAQNELARREEVAQADLQDQTRATVAHAVPAAPQTAMSIAMARAAGTQPPGYVPQEELLRRMEEWNRRQNAVREQSTGAMDVRNAPANGEGMGVQNAQPVQPARVQTQPAAVPEPHRKPNEVSGFAADGRSTQEVVQGAIQRVGEQELKRRADAWLASRNRGEEYRAMAIEAAARDVMAEDRYEKMLASAPRAKSPFERRNEIQPAKDTLFQAIAKLGGLNKQEVVSTWGTDVNDLKRLPQIFGKPLLRTNGGHSIDGMAELLVQHGYLDQRDLREFEAKFDQELRGKPVMTMQGHEQQAQLTAQAIEEDRKAEALDLTPAELVHDGYEALNGPEKEQVQSIIDALVQHAQGTDYEGLVDAILERAAIQAGDRPYKEYAQAVISQIREVIANAEHPNNQPAQAVGGESRQGGEETRQEARAEGRPSPTGQAAPAELALTPTTPEELRAAASPQALVQREAAERKAIADREREHFTLTPQAPAERVAAPSQQGGLFTPTGQTAEATKQPEKTKPKTPFEEFDAAREAYRARKIGDNEFLAAKKKYEESEREFDKSRGELARPYKDTPRQELQRIYHETDDDATLKAVEDELNLRAEEKAKAREERLAKGRAEKTAAKLNPEARRAKEVSDLRRLGLIKQEGKNYGPLWYSDLERAIQPLKQESAPADQWKMLLTNLKGVKKDELQWSGVTDWLDMQQGKVTKQQVLDYLKQNGVKVEETMLSNDAQQNFDTLDQLQRDWDEAIVTLDALGFDTDVVWNYEHHPRTLDDFRGVTHRADRTFTPVPYTSDETIQSWELPKDVKIRPFYSLPEDAKIAIETMERISKNDLFIEGEEAAANHIRGEQTKYSSYTLPGGQNYRELLLTLPEKSPTLRIEQNAANLFTAYDATGREVGGGSTAEMASETAKQLMRVKDNSFSSAHFSQPNILAHIRFDERTDAAGKKVLFIEEIQSDWAQKGKREGFENRQDRRPEDKIWTSERTGGVRQDWATENQARRAAGENGSISWRYKERGVPSAPFVTKTESWVSLALKRMIRYAAENGFDRVAWTTGEQQADRYDLSKHIGSLRASKISGGRYSIEAYRNDDGALRSREQPVLLKSEIEEKELPEYVGKAMADRIIADLAGERTTKSYKGLDLKIGGEGMRAFYDKIVPNVANDVLKKLGAGRVDEVHIENGGPAGVALGPEFIAQPGFDITPAMRDKAMQGMSLFQPKSEYNATQADKIYDNAQVRQGTTPEQKALGIAAIKAIFGRDRREGFTLLGSALWKDFQERKGTELVGQRIQGPRDLATLAQILRDPRFETFRFFFTKGDKIVGHTAISSRMPGLVNVMGMQRGKNPADVIAAFTDRLNKLRDGFEADGYWMLHNHPSGFSTPSGNDILFTENLASTVPGFKGHVVIDHDEFSTISATGDTKQHKVDSGPLHPPEQPHDMLGRTIPNENALRSIAYDLQAKSGFDVMLSINNKMEVVGIAEVPTRLLLEQGKNIIRARKFARGTGADRVFVISQNPSRLEKLVQSGAVTDATDYAGHRTLNQIGIYATEAHAAQSAYKPGAVQVEQKSSKYSDQTQTQEFKRWFGDSKVVDKNGKPRVVYHGTFSEDFDSFETDEHTTEGAAFFSVDPEVASSFANPEDWGHDVDEVNAHVSPVFLSIRNPLVVSGKEVTNDGDHSFDVMRSVVKRAREGGYDGLRIRRVRDGGKVADQWAAFYPEQIKSAIGNRGTFSPSDANILKQMGTPYGRVEPIGYEEVPRTGTMKYHGPRAEHPGVDWNARDLQDSVRYVTADSVLKDYGPKNGKAVVYQAWIDLSDLPSEQLVEEKDGNEGGYDWSEMEGLRGTYPPAKLRVTKSGNIEILDGNHRIRHWSNAGAEYIPAWVVDERKGAVAERPEAGIVEQTSTPYGDRVASGSASFVKDLLHSDARVGWWAKTIGTQQHKALTLPEFAPVYNEGQAFLSDISKYANGSADLAQDLLPRIEGFRDFFKKSPNKEDLEHVVDALYAGTLFGGGSPLEGKVWTDDELKQGRAIDKNGVSVRAFKPMNDAQIALYREAIAATSKSLDELGKSLIHRIVRQHGIGFDREMSLEDVVADVDAQIEDALSERESELEHVTDEDFIRDSASNAYEGAGGDREGERAARAEKARLAREADKLRAEIKELEGLQKQVKDIADKTTGLKTHGYFPAMRFGKYAVHVVETDEEGHAEQKYFGLYESQTKANLAARELKKEFPDAEVRQSILSTEQHRLFQGLSLDALETFADYITGENGQPISKDPLVQGFLKAAAAERSVLKRHIHRKGIAGFSDDLPRVLASFVTSSARATASNYHGAEMQKLANDIRAGDVKDEAIKLVRYLQDPQEEAQGLRGFLFMQYLGGSIANGLVNMTQPFMVTTPYLTQTTSASDAAIQLMKAAAAQAHPEKLKDGEAEAYKRAHREGVVAPQEIHQLRAQTGGLPLAKNLALRKLSYLWGSIYSLTEQFNRTTTFIAAYRIAEEKGLNNPYAFAKRAVEETQFVYNKGNRPNWARGPVGSTVMTFKQFSISYLELARRLYKKDKKAFALMALMLLAAGGIEGLPFAEDIEDMVDTMGQWLGYATNSKKKVRQWAMSILGPDFSQIALRGVSGLPWMPVDVSARMGMANLIPGTAMLKQSEKNKARDVIELLGPAGQLIPTEDTMLGKALERLGKGDIMGAVKSAAPRAVQAAAKGAEMLETGQARGTKGQKITNVTPGEAVFQMAGLQPASVARESQKIGIVQQDIDLQNREKSEISEQWARGIVDKEPDKVKAAREKLRQWNEDNPELRIHVDSRNILPRIKELRMTREERFVKHAPKEIRGGVREALR